MTERAKPDLAALMAEAQRGDEASYRTLLEAVQPMVIGYVRKRLLSSDAAEDICQDVLLTIHRVRHTFTPGRPFEPWLFSITRSRLIDHLRKVKRVSAFEVLMDVMPEGSGDASEASLSDAVAVLEKLPPSQREAFEMLKLEGLTTEEAAARAGVSVSALKVRAHRAYKTIRRAFLEEVGK